MAERTIPFNQLAKAGYNRGINRKHVNEIKKNFHEDMVQPAIVSFRDGKYWIVDHQHQSQAIYELNGNDPNTPIKCSVRTGLTYEQEADLYYRLNTGSKPLSFSDKLMGLIEAHDPVAIDFRDTVETCGYLVGSQTNNSIQAVSCIWKVFNKDGGKDELIRILTLTHACWPDKKNGVDSRLIEGVALFLHNHGDEYRADHFVKVMSAVDPREIVRKGQVYYRQMDSRSFTKPYCTYTIIVNIYNTGLHNKICPVSPGL